MGTDLSCLVQQSEVLFPKLKGKIIAIDGSNLLFQMIYNPGQKRSESFYTDRTFRAISHLYGLIYKITGFYKQGLFPFVVFDGKADELKRRITRNEAHDFKILEEWFNKARKENDNATLKSIASNPFFMWKTIVKEAKTLLISMGVPIFTAPGEAEAQCAYFTQEKYADFSLTSDFDTLLFGCPSLIQRLQFAGKEIIDGKWRSTKGKAFIISLEKTLVSNRIDLFQLIDFSLIIGNDFFEGINGIGPKTAINLIRNYGDIFSVIDKLKLESIDFERIQNARELLLFPVVTEKDPDLEWRCPNSGAIKSLLCNDHTLKSKKVEKAIDNLLNAYKKHVKNYV